MSQDIHLTTFLTTKYQHDLSMKLKMSEESDMAARTKPNGSQPKNLPEIHHGHTLTVHDGAQSVQRVIQRHIRQLFSNYGQHTLHPACRAKLARTGQMLQS
jgi:hypothetical protein